MALRTGRGWSLIARGAPALERMDNAQGLGPHMGPCPRPDIIAPNVGAVPWWCCSISGGLSLSPSNIFCGNLLPLN